MGLHRHNDPDSRRLGTEPSCLAALKIKRIALDRLFVANGGNNLSETMWLGSELAAVETQGLRVA